MNDNDVDKPDQHEGSKLDTLTYTTPSTVESNSAALVEFSSLHGERSRDH